ncbi:hypothetical protein UAJ10_05245 [Nitrospirillum sp. BR 11164]|uniref:hypothetical protein n=1 Tax=Nitrospirillum sp. BR 11164 TaxID=3104324 RepID=UPI002B002A23|nr:hypothetical protein [Nitrospirillum sp. BR 11164]MEA1648417.1 hypothetical protein [Nitrospirillum sp. BR 11164]
MSMVLSYPLPAHQVADADLEKWIRLSIDWAIFWAKAHRLDFRTSVHHKDEPYPHMHLYFLPRPEDGMRADDCHPGKVAKKLAEDQARNEGIIGKNITRAGNKAYKAAMVAFQDEYWEKVGIVVGLTRTGPRRRRLSQGDWQREKASAARLAKARSEAADLVTREAALEVRQRELQERETAFEQRMTLEQSWTADQLRGLEVGRAAVSGALKAMANDLSPSVAEEVKRLLEQAGDITSTVAVLKATAGRQLRASRAGDELDMDG